MTGGRPPGQPLAAMSALLALWIVVRIAVWEPPFAKAAYGSSDRAGRGGIEAPASSHTLIAGVARRHVTDARKRGQLRASLGDTEAAMHSSDPSVVRAPLYDPDPTLALTAAPHPVAQPMAMRQTAAQAGFFPPATPLTEPPGIAAPRLSGAGWVMLRSGSAAGLGVGPLGGRYGGSQAGAALRYRLGSRDSRAALHARTTAALDPLADRELALGVSARPVRVIPVRLQAELRARETGRSLDFAPAAMAVGEMNPISLPLGLRAEPYFAAGYVGGVQATPFADGSLRVDRPLARAGASELRLGGGAWGGAQRGAAALDVGPSATLRSVVGGQPVALSIDYRLRAAGSAEPGSGLAVTLSAGF